MVYQYMYSPDGSMHGFVNHTLSYFNVSDFQDDKRTEDTLNLGYSIEICRWEINLSLQFQTILNINRDVAKITGILPLKNIISSYLLEHPVYFKHLVKHYLP